MAVSQTLQFAELDDLWLDPQNPRLGRHNTSQTLSQGDILKLMANWKLDELAVSFLESGGYWSQEAMIVAKEVVKKEQRLVVLEGNRRLAALINLRQALSGNHPEKKWREIADGAVAPPDLFNKIPYFVADRRDDIEGFLGFRHVTGIEQWRPAEKAEYITKLVEKGLTYKEVMRKIGSKTPAVRQNYVSYKLLLQIEEGTDVPVEKVEERFSVLYLSLRTEGVRKYLRIDLEAEPERVRREIPRIHKNNLASFALWLFGDDRTPPLFSDSRQVDNFGRILESKEALEYLGRSSAPNFDVALRMAGGDEPEIIRLIGQAADNVELALSKVHHYKKSPRVRSAVGRLAKDVGQLLGMYPDIKKSLCEEGE